MELSTWKRRGTMGILEVEFELLDTDHDGFVSNEELMDALEMAGLSDSDPRLKSMLESLDALRGSLRRGSELRLSLEMFLEVVYESAALVSRALSKDLIIPAFKEFTQEIEKLYTASLPNRGGNVADYIPELACADPEAFSVSICTIDGQCWSIGSSDVNFCVQSCMKPISYLLACEELGLDYVHQFVGCEPSGVKFNEMVLKNIDPSTHSRGTKAIPHNPMVNAGAIMISSLLLDKEKSIAKRFKSIVNTWTRLFAGKKPNFQNATFLSERETAHRNSALGYMMLEMNAFPPKTSLRETLELYFQCCSLETNTESMAVMAASLANHGVCPLTEDRIFSRHNVRACLSVMSSCGMYDYSGYFNFKIGIPAKSGVAGCVFLVIPNQMGIAIYSPRLDVNGNSVRAVDFCRRLSERFSFHVFEKLAGFEFANEILNPRIDSQKALRETLTSMIYAASIGDVHCLRRLASAGFDVSLANYDDRTALHLAASSGHLEATEYLIGEFQKLHDLQGRDLRKLINPKDRWKRTPLDDAITGGFMFVEKLLRQFGGVEGHGLLSERAALPTVDQHNLPPTEEIQIDMD